MKLKPVFSVAYIVFILSVLIALFLGLAMADIEKVLQHPVRYEIVYEDTTGAIEKSDIYVWWNVTLDRIANAWGTANSKVDLNRDGTVDFKDYMIWVNHTGLYEDSVTYRVVDSQGNTSISMEQGATEKLYLRLVRQTGLLSTRQIYSNIISSNPLVGTFSSPSIIIQNRIEVGDSVEITDKGVSMSGETMSFLSTGNVAEFDYTATGIGTAVLQPTKGTPLTISQKKTVPSDNQWYSTNFSPVVQQAVFSFDLTPVSAFMGGDVRIGNTNIKPIQIAFSPGGVVYVRDGQRGWVENNDVSYLHYHSHKFYMNVNLRTQTYSVHMTMPDDTYADVYTGYRENTVPVVTNAEFQEPITSLSQISVRSYEGSGFVIENFTIE